MEWFRYDIAGFCRYYLGDYFTAQLGAFHKAILLANESQVVEVPRGHGKSTAIMGLLVHAAVYGYRKFIVYVSGTSEQATAFVRRVRDELESNERIRADFGEQRGESWTERYFVTSGGVAFRAVGATGSIRGVIRRQHRPDLLIVDDLEDDEAVHTAERREKLWSKLTSAVFNLGGFDGMAKVIVGTPLHNDCILRRLKRQGWPYRRFPAIDGDGNVLWPQAWTREKLDEKRQEIGSLSFTQEFLLEPIDEGSLVFLREWITYYDDDTPDHWPRVLYVDPAIALKKSSDFFVGTVLAFSPHGEARELRVVEHYVGKLSVARQVQKITELATRHRCMLAGIEAIAYQDALRQLVQEEFARSGVMTAVTPIMNSSNKELRIRKVSPLVEFGVLKFHAAHSAMVDHLCQYPSVSHDDIEDSLAGAVEMVRRQGRLT